MILGDFFPRNVEAVCRFPELPARRQLSYQAKQLIAREIELEKMRRAEARNLGQVRLSKGLAGLLLWLWRKSPLGCVFSPSWLWPCLCMSGNPGLSPPELQLFPAQLGWAAGLSFLQEFWRELEL